MAVLPVLLFPREIVCGKSICTARTIVFLFTRIVRSTFGSYFVVVPVQRFTLRFGVRPLRLYQSLKTGGPIASPRWFSLRRVPRRFFMFGFFVRGMFGEPLPDCGSLYVTRVCYQHSDVGSPSVD